MKNLKSLKALVKNFNRAKVLVIGDLILDEYISGGAERISPEAPVPVIWADKRHYVPGGAANVVNNILAMDAKASAVGVVGDDLNAKILVGQLKKRGADISGVFVQPRRHTTLKTRILAGHQQVVRVDWEHRDPLSKEVNEKILKFIEKKLPGYDGLVIEDYGKGVVNSGLLERLVELAKKYKKILTVDPKEENFFCYRGVTAITPNRKELENAVRNLKIKDMTNSFRVNSERLFTDKEINTAAFEVMGYLGLESVLVTLGEQGMRLFEKGKNFTHIPTVAQEVFDVSGAGDTVIACFTLALCLGASKLQAAHIANFAAGIVVSKLGTAVTTRPELLSRIK